MDKKNTMLLTVIAVATLLVAVVGATFAYFSVAGKQTATTNVSASAGKIGAVNVTQGSDDLTLSVSAQDMAKPGTDKSYYAISKASDTDNEGKNTGGVWKGSENEFTVATVSLENAAENDTVKCDLTVDVTISGTMAGHLNDGDVYITLSDDLGELNAEQISLDTLNYTSGKGTDNATATKAFNLGRDQKLELKNGSSKTLKAKVWLVNKSTQDTGEQNYLAGKTLDVAIKTTVSNCETTSPAVAGA